MNIMEMSVRETIISINVKPQLSFELWSMYLRPPKQYTKIDPNNLPAHSPVGNFQNF